MIEKKKKKILRLIAKNKDKNYKKYLLMKKFAEDEKPLSDL